MREQIIGILGKIGRPKDLNDINSPAFWLDDAAEEIIKIIEFEELCNHPEEGEANMNEAVIAQNYVSKEEYDRAMNHIGELEEQIADMKEDLRLSRQDRSGEYGW
jgi:hypothetical protein